MVRAGRLIRFAFSPKPAHDELLSSWLHRMAIGHAASGLEFLRVAGGDIDWRPPDELLVRLVAGSEQPLAKLRAMTLSEVYPEARRDWFAWSDGTFPGCHAFCPLCARDDLAIHGAVIQRKANAGLWRAACVHHLCLLDGVEELGHVLPRAHRKAPWEDGSIRPSSFVAEAPEFLLAFQATAEAALNGAAPDERWLVREPKSFLISARAIADLLLLSVQVEFTRTSALDQIVGHVWPEVSRLGADFRRPGWIDRLPTPARGRTLAGVALLLMAPAAWPALTLDGWLRTSGYQDPGPRRPWARVVRAWGTAEMSDVLTLIGGWPASLRREAERGLAMRGADMRARGYDLGSARRNPPNG